MKALTVTLPGLPPTVNHAYQHTAGGGKRRTAAAQAWSTGAILALRSAAAVAAWAAPARTPLAVTVVFTGPRIYTFDLDNRLKGLLDALMGALGLDDRYIVWLTVNKYYGAADATTLTVSVCGVPRQEGERG